MGKKNITISNIGSLLLTYLKLDCTANSMGAQGTIWAEVRRLQNATDVKEEVLPCKSYDMSTTLSVPQ